MTQPAESLAPVTPDASAPSAARRRLLYAGVAGAAALGGAGFAWWKFQPHAVEPGAEQALWGLEFETPAGSTVAPLRTARLVSGAAAFARFTGSSLYGRLRWQCVDNTAWTAATETTYRSYPVMTHRTNWDADPSREYVRRLATVDSGNGAPSITDF